VVVAERVASLEVAGVASAPQTSVLGAPAHALWLPPRLRMRADGGGVLIRPDELVPFDGSSFGDAVPGSGVVDALPGTSGELRRLETGDGPWERLLGGGGETWAVARRPATVLRRIEPSEELRELGPGGLDPVMDADGRLAWVEGGRELHVDGAAPVACEAGGRPIGLAAGRAYLAHGAGLTVVEPDGSVAWRFAADGIVPGPDGSVVVARVHDGALEVDERTLPLPSVGREVAWRLIAARDGEYVLWGGARGPAVLAVLDADGGVVRLDDPAPEDARLGGWWPAAPYEWQVDAEGRVYVVLAGPDGVIVARLASYNLSHGD
jgi:hypothetical protein